MLRRWALERHSVRPEESVIGPILRRSFYRRPTIDVARDLLGKILVHGETAGTIVETEAYLGAGDLAAHCAAGITERTRVIFGPPGHAYVYLSYGIHECLNIVAEPDGTPGCVLIRSLEPLAGLDIMRSRRPGARTDRDLTSGPGKLTSAMAINRAHNGADLTRGDLTVRAPAYRHEIQIAALEIVVTPRIGITKCADLPLRFVVKGNKFLSKPGVRFPGVSR
jgi:DNA-3-methyladenine glycosylase